jgi:hypothetical protein
VNAKYKTKNNNTDGKELFLATINQTIANANSSSNLRLIDKRLCRVWLSGSLFWPLKKMIRVMSEIIKNTEDRMAKSLKIRLSPIIEIRRDPVPRNNTSKKTSCKIYL